MRNTIHIAHYMMPWPIAITFSRYTKAMTHLQQHIMNRLVNSLAMWALSFNNIPSINEFSHIGNATPGRRSYEVIFTDRWAIITSFRVTTTRTKCSAFKDWRTWNVGISTQNVRKQRLEHCWGCFGFDTSILQRLVKQNFVTFAHLRPRLSLQNSCINTAAT